MVDDKLLHDPAFMKEHVLYAQRFTAKSQCCVMRITIVNCFQECGFNLYLTSNDEDATDLSIGEDDWGQLKAGTSFQEYASCDTGAITCELRTLEQAMDEKFTSMCLKRRRGRWIMMVEKVNLQEHFCQQQRA